MTTEFNTLLKLAIQNNAEWCDIVCRSHGMPGSFQKEIWVNLQEVPMYYPNIITLEAGDINNLEVQISRIIDSVKIPLSIKDSFNTFNLGPFGFKKLFEAQWLLAPKAVLPTLKWKIITTSDDLVRWERSWSQGKSQDLFLPSLLANSAVRFIAIYENDEMIAGAIVNKSEGVVGLSNIFCYVREPKQYWLTCMAAAQAEFPGLPIVGYESRDELILATSIGFQPLGPLSVWSKTQFADSDTIKT